MTKKKEKAYQKLQNADTELKEKYAVLLQILYSNDKNVEKEYQKLQKVHTELKDKHATLLQTMYSNEKMSATKLQGSAGM